MNDKIIPYEKVDFNTARIQIERALSETFSLLRKLQMAGKICDMQLCERRITQTAISQLEIVWIDQEEVQETRKNQEKMMDSVLTICPTIVECPS